jgi:membrane protein involved in colicin uptake
MNLRVHNAWRARAGTIAWLAVPLVMLSACADNEDKLAEQLAAAEAAADKAVAAQRAAEKAAAVAADIRPSAPPVEPEVMDDSDFENDDLDQNEDESPSEGGESEFSMGGSGQTISPDGVVIPGQGV